ncbi:AP-2 complex subunit mu C-terminal superfamily [Arabidopsis thaliana x Arabidopsis arenosa]|uniref:AP-2 complex subunit mu C-terminal superfamily n=1 Tax=Arabidopsis thaliana x Arabidopsis arenosa TaxID=1240361 RepID=A0A8T2BZ06_9BRAS|nr:AP-2 complex subunit mu C-terminal superfamily [Arabidopsis thaliana x Arabidopsis arenosa]
MNVLVTAIGKTPKADPSVLEHEHTLKADFHLPSIAAEEATPERKAPIRVKFEIPKFIVSGIQVRYLKIIEKSGYQAHPWVRYITMAGEYELRLM